MTTPASPSRRSKATVERDRILSDLSIRWGLKLEPPKDGESPSKRQEKLAVARESAADRCMAYAYSCVFKINFLCFKDEIGLSLALKAFDQNAAAELQSGWVCKPNADEDLLPRSDNSPNFSVTMDQRERLLKILLESIEPAFETAKERQKVIKGGQTLRRTTSLGEVPHPAISPLPNPKGNPLDDTPIPFRLKTKGKGKRPSDGDSDLNDSFKRPKALFAEDASSLMVIDAVDNVRQTKSIGDLMFATRNTPWDPGTLIMASASGASSVSVSLPPDIGVRRLSKTEVNTTNTSFASNISSVFSHEESSDETYFSTQTSVIDISFAKTDPPETSSLYGSTTDEKAIEDAFNLPPETGSHYGSTIGDKEMEDALGLPSETSSHYGSAIDYKKIEDIFRGPPEDLLRDRLQKVLPEMPAFLGSAPLPIRYEITRVCSYAKVPMTDLRFPSTNFSRLLDYDSLWRYLRNDFALKGKEFPEKSNRDAWKASLDKFNHRFQSVLLSAKLSFSDSQDGPFFTFQLQPLKFKVSHRLGRRFGHDRFIEVSLPSLYGRKLPKLLKDAEAAGCGDACRQVINEWLLRNNHSFLGISWGPFYIKDMRRRKAKFDISSAEALDNTASHCIYFFATDGVGFQARKTIPPKEEPPQQHTKMTVTAMLNWLIPLDQNKEQSYLKLFSRIALGLSKTWKTVELDVSEIRHLEDDLRSDVIKEVMNDGCGRLSPKMAWNVANCLGLTYVPSGFQARIGGAKGFWIVDVNESSEQQWIETYPSQRKWKRDQTTGSGDTEADHRTFEVVDWVKPLKSAALNLQFLPLLEDRGKSRPAMREAISRLLVTGLTHEISRQREAMDSPQAFRKWVRDNNSGIEDRIKHGQVAYKAGLPVSLEEQLNMLLDAGFDPKSLHFLKDLAWKAYKSKCDVLKKKLNIVVGRSTYAYMAVDFTGSLGPGEAHLGFSTNFKDEVSGFDEVLLDGIDILVARSPAHYISDIQRVKAVWKRELKALKDVIVFPSTGDYPLAQKLSGGDYDGDTAWICFEPSIVEEFVNANPPECPDLVKLGYIRADKIKYSELTSECIEPVPTFLENSFGFNLGENLLGICTTFKEKLCYTKNNVRNYEAIFLSTLLSYLVDRCKQGYTFTSEDWGKIQDSVIKEKPREPNYRLDKLEGNRTPEHIIDYLKFSVAEQTIENTLSNFHNSLQIASYWDDDLVQLAQWAKDLAKTSRDWAALLAKLESDITDIQSEWKQHFNSNSSLESLSNFTIIVTQLYDKFHAIAPGLDKTHPLSQALAPSCLPNTDFSPWSLLKASFAFSTYPKTYVSKFVWWMAGKQLACLKAQFARGARGEGGLTPITPEMYAMLRPDATYVKLMQSQQLYLDPCFWEARAESVVLDEETGADMEFD